MAKGLEAAASPFALLLFAINRRREQWLPRSELAARRTQRLLAILRKARAAPYYRRVLPDVPNEGTCEELLANVPILDKRTLSHEGLDAFLTSGRDNVIAISTSGSTGEPTKFVRSALEETEHSARLHRVHAAYGCRPRDRILNVGSPLIHRRRGAATVLRDLRLLPEIRQVFVGLPPEEMVRVVQEFEPQLIAGYSVGLEGMAHHIIDKGIKIKPPRRVLCGAMDVSEHCIDVVQRAFGAPAMNVYTSNELGVVGWECPQQRGSLHINDDVHVLEILDENDQPVPDGIPGEVILTSLSLMRMPLIRYRIGDIAARIAQPCSCGRGLGLITPVDGRTAHTIVGPEGQRFTGATVGSVLKAAGAYEWVRQFQVHEQPNRQLLVLIQPRARPGVVQTQELLSQFRRIFGPSYTFRIELRDELPLTPAGKYQFLVPLSGRGPTGVVPPQGASTHD